VYCCIAPASDSGCCADRAFTADEIVLLLRLQPLS